MKETVKIFALGGLNENGKSMFVVSIDEDLYIFDAGIRYPEESLLGIDLILPGLNYLFENKRHIKGIFLTHGHDENLGSIPYLAEEIDVPIFGTKFTLLMLENFAERIKKPAKFNYHIIKPTDVIELCGRKIYPFAVTHGSSEALGYALETSNGLIVYTGDFIVDITCRLPQYQFDFKRITDLSQKPVLCLLSDSYNSTFNGYVAPHHKMAERMHSIFEDVKGRVFISLYGQNIFGMREVIETAYKTKRRIYFYSEYTKNLVSIIESKFENVEIYGNIQNALSPLEAHSVILVTEIGNKLFEILNEIADNNQSPEKSLKINEDDAFILASPPHSGTELSFARTLDRLYKTNAQVYNISKETISMHAGSEDLRFMISMFKPKYYMPVRGQYIKMIENAKIALDMGYNHNNILVFDNGMVATFVNGEMVKSVENIECNEIMVDGIGIGDVGSVVINDRRKLSKDGVMIIGISFSMATREIMAGPDIQMRGLIFLKENETIIKKVSETFEEIVFKYVQTPGMVDFNELRMLCREQISKLIKSELGKDPMILPVIISV